jgi:cell wall-associated NlpC family hydrolase
MTDQLATTSAGFYVPVMHLKPVGENETDFVGVAERFLGAPYLWGGKTVLGIDCSGLLQVALTAAGVQCPRDSDMQERALGRALTETERSSRLQRGDLIFWKGHVAIVRDGESLLHANAFHMAVAIEPIAQALARIRATGAEVTSMRRVVLA